MRLTTELDELAVAELYVICTRMTLDSAVNYSGWSSGSTGLVQLFLCLKIEGMGIRARKSTFVTAINAIHIIFVSINLFPSGHGSWIHNINMIKAPANRQIIIF